MNDTQDENVLITIAVTLVAGAPCPDDEGVAGWYQVAMPASVPAADRADLALDCFHDHVGIACLDDFEILPLDAAGQVLETREVPRQDLVGVADFLGPVDPD